MSWVHENATRHFDQYPAEQDFIKHLGSVFQVTYANRYKTSISEYSYYILKPYAKPSQRYGISGEILALYSPYMDLQARTIVAAQALQQQYKERVHPVWIILISDDPNVVVNFGVLTEGKDLEVYGIPFSRQELEKKPDAKYINSRIADYIRSRDLFAVQSPLQTDLFFFGRKDLVQSITAQIENGQNFGLFGLRRIGKTSVLLAVERYLEKLDQYLVVHTDCQSPSIYLRRWNSLIALLTAQIAKTEGKFLSDADQVEAFTNAVRHCPKRVLLIFDEIENISFGDLSPSKHWNEDFLPFWGAIRAVHQVTHGRLTFGVAGVNPFIFEVPIIQNMDNPVLLGVSPLYLHPLQVDAVSEMVETIGAYMGISFEETVYRWLYEQFGGHPFLIRKACSLIFHKTEGKALREIGLSEFISRQEWLDRELGGDVMRILVVLALHYPNEFENLWNFACGETEWIGYLRQENPEELAHILNYRIVSEDSNGEIKFVTSVLERFLLNHGNRFLQAVEALKLSANPTQYNTLPSPEHLELWTRIGRARNSVEPRLRAVIHRALLLQYGEKQALQLTINAFDMEKQKQLAGHNLSQIFNGESKALYLRDAKDLVLRHWDLVKHIFGNDKKGFEFRLDKLNADGRSDTHANPVDEATAVEVEAIANSLLQQMAPFLD